MEVEILSATSGKTMTTIQLSPDSTIVEVKAEFYRQYPKFYPERQSFRLEPKGKTLKDDTSFESLNFDANGKLFFKDLGPQIGWSTVFLIEYSGPLLIYLWIYTRPTILYGSDAALAFRQPVVKLAAFCWSLHYLKRLLETLFVHRFSHSTMPIRNLFKNCSYYWVFAGYVAYYVNHPLYTPPTFGDAQIYTGLALFALSEIGNLSIHLALKNLRPEGSNIRKIPMATSNPFTWLFNLVSCPNYSYEFYSWIGFTILTQCLPAGLFALAGFYQMSVWALQKHKAYKQEFVAYPKRRKAIIPYLI